MQLHIILKNNSYFQSECEVCKYMMTYFKRYDNGLLITFLKTLLSIFGDLKNLSIFLFQCILIYYFLGRIKNVLDCGNSIIIQDFDQNNFLNFFHEFVIIMSIFFGVKDIFKYYNSIFTDNRKLSLKFIKKA